MPFLNENFDEKNRIERKIHILKYLEDISHVDLNFYLHRMHFVHVD